MMNIKSSDPTLTPWNVAYCDTCFTNFYYTQEGELAGMVWYRYLATGKFCMFINYDANTFTISRYRPDNTKEYLLRIDCIPNWTPLNSVKKLKLYLPFL